MGCGGTGSAPDLLRVVLDATVPDQPSESGQLAPSGVVVDLIGKLPGRGAWLHPQLTCIERACSRGFSKVFGAAIRTTAPELLEQLRSAAERRLSGLLLASLRSRQLVYGRDAVKEILGQNPLVIMALDAQAVAKDGDLQRAGFEGKVVWWSTKAQLGLWLGRSEVGVVAITERAIAEVMRKTIALASLAPGSTGNSRSTGSNGARRVEQTVDQDAEQGAESAASEAESSSELVGSAEPAGGAGLIGSVGSIGSAEAESGAVAESSAVRDDELSEVR